MSQQGSKPLRALILDDERLSAVLLRRMIEVFCPELQVLATVQSLNEAEAFLQNNPLEVLFLDLQLRDGLGFELLERCPQARNLQLVCVTAYHEYALKAFQYGAVHYLLKPLQQEDLRAVVERISKTSLANNSLEELHIPTRKKVERVELQELIFLEADNNYTFLFLKDGRKILSSKTLSYFDRLLEEDARFVRIHKKYLVNMSYFRNYDRHEHYLELSPWGQKLAVSVRKRQQVLAWLKSPLD